MRIYQQILPLFMLALVLSGCASANITNLTPSRYDRNMSGLYQVAAQMDSDQQTLLWKTIRPNVLIGNKAYPMQPTPLMHNRWETLIPVAPGTNVVYYSFKFDFDYTGMGKQNRDSKLSPTYSLDIRDK